MTRLLNGRYGKRFVKYFQTFHLLMAGVTMGLVLVLVGPSLLDLADILGVSVRQVTFVSFGGDFGCFVGSALALILFKYIGAQKVLIFSVLLMGISNMLIPHGGSTSVTASLTFCTGMGVGIVEIGAYVWIVGLWPERVAPMTQMLHLSYGIGAFISPLIAEPYLQHHERPEELMFNLTEVNGTEVLNELLDGAFNSSSGVNVPPKLVGESQVYIPYAIIGCFALLNATLMIVSFCMDSNDVAPARSAKEGKDEAKLPTTKVYQWTLVSLVSFYTMLLVVLEVTVGKLLPAYVVHHFKLDRSTAAYLLSLFYIGFTSGRVLAVPISLKFSPMQIMNAAQATLVTSAAFLTFMDTNERILWICFFTLGMSLSPLFGCSTAWLSKHVTLSHDFMSAIMTIVTFGALAPPLLVGSYLETHPYILMYLVLLAACCMIAVSWSLKFAATMHKKMYRRCPVVANDELKNLNNS